MHIALATEAARVQQSWCFMWACMPNALFQHLRFAICTQCTRIVLITVSVRKQTPALITSAVTERDEQVRICPTKLLVAIAIHETLRRGQLWCRTSVAQQAPHCQAIPVLFCPIFRCTRHGTNPAYWVTFLAHWRRWSLPVPSAGAGCSSIGHRHACPAAMYCYFHASVRVCVKCISSCRPATEGGRGATSCGRIAPADL